MRNRSILKMLRFLKIIIIEGRQNEIKKALNPQGFLAGEEGIEPPLTVLETAALPLYYSPICYCLLCSSPTDMSITQVFSLCK